MLELKNINIQFKNNVIIENGSLSMRPFEITLLTGASGIGKTSILNIIGLLDSENQYDYILDNKIIDNNVKQNLRRYDISYVFQDYNILEDFTILDNLKTMFNISGQEYNQEIVKDVLKFVSIDNSRLKDKIKKLSGGEKQRVAIALALLKKPKILLLDEPTANLDEENANQIVSILQSLKRKGLIIVIATHNPDIYEAEHIYTIKDKKIIEEKSVYTKIEETPSDVVKNRKKKFNYFSYIINYMSYHILIYSLLLLVLSFSLYNVSSYYMTANKLSSNAFEYLDAISDNEILIINNQDLITDDEGWHYTNEGKKISLDVLNEIYKIDHIDNIYPYYKNCPTFGCNINGEDVDVQNDIYLNDVKCHNKLVNVYQLFNETLSVTSCDSKYKEKECYELDENLTDGVFISKRLADKLGISKLDNTEITFNMPIIMGYQYNEGYATDENGEPITEMILRYPNNIFYKEMTYKVKGIYEQSMDYSQFYDNYGYTDLYVDYREIERLHNEAVSDNKIMNIYQEYMDKFDLGTSMYIITVDNVKYMNEVQDGINNYHYDINVKTKNNEVDTLTTQIDSVYQELLLMPFIILGVASLLIVLLYTYTLHQRKKELSFLKANGIKNSFILPFITMAIILSISALISSMICLLTPQAINYNIKTFGMTLVIVTTILIICLIINKIYYKNTDIIQELRSK